MQLNILKADVSRAHRIQPANIGASKIGKTCLLLFFGGREEMKWIEIEAVLFLPGDLTPHQFDHAQSCDLQDWCLKEIS